MDSRIQNAQDLKHEHQKELARTVMRRQVTLSLKITAIFTVILFGLPLFNKFMPEAANTKIFGFTLTWLILGVLFYPITWLLSWWFIRESENIESDIVKTLGADIETTAHVEQHPSHDGGMH